MRICFHVLKRFQYKTATNIYFCCLLRSFKEFHVTKYFLLKYLWKGEKKSSILNFKNAKLTKIKIKKWPRNVFVLFGVFFSPMVHEKTSLPPPAVWVSPSGYAMLQHGSSNAPLLADSLSVNSDWLGAHLSAGQELLMCSPNDLPFLHIVVAFQLILPLQKNLLTQTLVATNKMH